MKLKQGTTLALLTLTVAALAICTGDAVALGGDTVPGERIIHPINPDQLAAAPTAGSTGVIRPVISNHGGPVMGTPNVYLIWYGNWATSNGSDTAAGQQLVRGFLFGLNNSPYYKTNASYGTPTGSVISAGETTVGYTQGTALSDASILTIVTTAISSHSLPSDPFGIYLVLTSSDVNETSGFCTAYCGWHTHASISGVDIKYSFVGNAQRCLSACAIQAVSPNNNPGVDGMLSVIAHETEETNTDPDLNAWYSRSGAEDADMCAWTFGSHQTLLSNGSYYNMSMADSTGAMFNYMIQRELDVNSKCYVNYVTKTQ